MLQFTVAITCQGVVDKKDTRREPCQICHSFVVTNNRHRAFILQFMVAIPRHGMVDKDTRTEACLVCHSFVVTNYTRWAFRAAVHGCHHTSCRGGQEGHFERILSNLSFVHRD